MRDDTIPNWLWRAGIAALLGSVAAVIAVLGLVLGGIGDPKPAGPLAVHDELDEGAEWQPWPSTIRGEVRDGAYYLTIPEQKTHGFATAPYTLRCPCTVELAARQAAGPREAAYGLWLGQGPPDGAYLVAAVNGNDYFSVFIADDQPIRFVEDWRRFPHIMPQGVVNRLRIDLIGEWATIRVNDEVAATFEWRGEKLLHAGFYAETFNTGGTVAAVDWLKVWAASDD